MEAIVGGDLSPVVLHTDTQAADRAARARALAVTYRNDVDFASGAYRPGTLAGEALLAHELAHVHQQQGSSVRPGSPDPGLGLEAEADQAALVAAMWHYDPASARVARAPRISRGRGLRLQCCTEPEYPEIAELPSREEYERRGELMPRELAALEPLTGRLELGIAAGMLVLEPSQLGAADGPAERPPSARTPPLPQPSASAAELTTDQLVARLLVMEQRQERIDALTADIPRGLVLSPAISFGFIRYDLLRGRPRAAELPGAATGQPPDEEPLTPQNMSRLLPRAEEVQRRVLDALVDLAVVREREAQSHNHLAESGYDIGGALAEIDEVRRAYADTMDVFMTPREVTRLQLADALRAQLETKLLEYLVRYHEQRTASGEEIAPAVAEMQDWARTLGAELARLVAEADEISAARELGEVDVDVRERAFARDAQLVATSLDALSEWDVALTAYEALREHSGLWGYDAIMRIADRMRQMKSASVARDEPYLRLLVRDHRTDPTVAGFYESLPEIIRSSQMIIGFAIVLVAAIVTAGVGVAITGFAAGAAATAEASALAAGASASAAAAKAAVILEVGLVAKIGGEALVFTVIHRTLSSSVPGMAPRSPFLEDLAWNLALFGALHGTSSVVQGAVSRSAWMASLVPRVRAVLAGGARLGGAYATLQAYGYVRFIYDEKRLMSLSEVGTMSVHNLAMLAGLSVGMAPFSAVLRGIEAEAARFGGATTQALIAFRARYGARFRALDSERANLQRRLAQRIDENPQATKDDVVDIESQAADIDARLRSLVDEAVTDPATDVEGLRAGLTEVTALMQATPLPELFGRMGLDPTIDVRATGDPATWTFAPGRGDAVATFLGENGMPMSSETTAGLRTFEVAVAGRGPVALVERAGPAAPPAPTPAPAGATGAAPSPLDALAGADRSATTGLAAVRGQTVVPDLAARLEARAAAGETALVRSLLQSAGQMAAARGEGRAPEPGAPAPPGEAFAEGAAEAFNALRNHTLALDVALADARAATGLRKLTTISGYRTAPAAILAAAPPENVGPFLRAMADPGFGWMPREFYQGLARSRAACDLVDRYGSRVLFRLIRLQGPDVPPGLQVARARVDIDRVLQGLEATAARDPAAAAQLRDRIVRLRSDATFRALDVLVGARPAPGAAFEANKADPAWPTYVARAARYARDHPVEGGRLSNAELEMRATLLQTVERARAREFGDLTPEQRQEMLERFNELALAARLDRGWTSATRGYLNEALGLGVGRASIAVVFLNGRVVPRRVEGSTAPDEAMPPVRADEMLVDAAGRRLVEALPRMWVERKSYELGGDVDAAGVSVKGRNAARRHANEAREDLENLPPGSTIALEYASDPGGPTREAMLRILFAEAGIVQVTFHGVTYTRGGRR